VSQHIGHYPEAKAKDAKNQHALKYKKKTRSYKMPGVKLPALVDLEYPADASQIPDVFINFWTPTWKKDRRVAYLRAKIKDCLSKSPKPNWFRLSIPYNTVDDGSPG